MTNISIEPGGKMPPDALMTQAWPVKSIITHPTPNAQVSIAKPLLVAGKAWAGDNDIARVEVSFNKVAARYKGDGAAQASLAKKIREGGSGAWGPIPMPPHPQIADADLKRVVDWVLQQ